MDFNFKLFDKVVYKAVVTGGRGCQTWDKEVEVVAGSFREALEKMEKRIKGEDAEVVSLELLDKPVVWNPGKRKG